MRGIPLNVHFKGKVPPYTTELEDEPIILTKEDKEKTKAQLFQDVEDVSFTRTHLPKQHEIDRYMERLKRKIIHAYDTPITLKELKAAYPKDPFFKDIYIYITRGYCMYKGYARTTFKLECEDYTTYQGILFRFAPRKKGLGPKLMLCIPRMYVPVLLYQYHDMILSGHHGITKTLETLQQKYFFPEMIMYIKRYIKGCEICQARKDRKDIPKAFYPRIPLDFRPMARVSLDAKFMPHSRMGYEHILVCTCEISNWIIAVPVQDTTAPTLFEAIFYRLICWFGSPKTMITDEAGSLKGEVMNELCDKLQIQHILISPENHGSNRTERYIRSLSDRLVGYLKETGSEWPLFVYPCAYAMNTFVSVVTGYTPYEMVFLRPPPDITTFDIHPEVEGITLPVKDYMALMEERLKLMTKMVKDEKKRQQELQVQQEKRRHPKYTGYEKGDLVLFKYNLGSNLQMSSRKFKSPWIGPVKIQAVLDDSHYLVSDWEGECLPVEIETHRLKPYHMNIYEDGEMMSLQNIYKHLEMVRLHQENKILKDHVARRNKQDKDTQTG